LYNNPGTNGIHRSLRTKKTHPDQKMIIPSLSIDGIINNLNMRWKDSGSCFEFVPNLF